jgi:hypothetical protein
MRVLVKYRSMSTSVGRVRNGDIIDIPEAEYNKICVTKPNALEALPELPLEKPAPKKAAPKKPAAKKAPAKRKRARKADGTLKADDPSTPDVNEAWEDGKHLN